jgi:hypothetical protein
MGDSDHTLDENPRLFAVRIVTQDGDEDLKVFDRLDKADRRFNQAWILLLEDAVSPRMSPERVRMIRRQLGMESVERVELHECRGSSPTDAAREVRGKRSSLRKFYDFDQPFGELEPITLDLDPWPDSAGEADTE